MADTPEIHAEQGQPTQLPQGAASDLNDQLQSLPGTETAVSPSPDNQAPEPTEAPSAPQGAAEGQEMGIQDLAAYRPTGDLEQFLASPSQNTFEDTPRLLPPVPRDIDDWLPWLQEANLSPSAPESQRELARRIAQDIGPDGLM